MTATSDDDAAVLRAELIAEASIANRPGQYHRLLRLADAIPRVVDAARREAVDAALAPVEELAAKFDRETEPYMYGGARYEKASDTLVARADCRYEDAGRIRAVIKQGRSAAL